jgi:predicted ATP-dependent serine protease
MNAMTLGMNSGGAKKLGSVKIPEKYFNRFGTGVSHIDDMFGQGGFIKGQVITMSAMRGAGKTTALLQILQQVTKKNRGKKCIYISGEEFIEQLAFAAQRLQTPDVLADNVTDADKLIGLTKKYDVMVIDSLASVSSDKFKSDGKLQSYFINKMYSAAKENDCVVVIIMHMTKDGKTKGNSSIEHTVDTCVKLFTVDPEVYGVGAKAFCIDKNRFGQTADTVFRMGKRGWDFTCPLDTTLDGQDKPIQRPGSKPKGGQRAIVQKQEMEAIVALIQKKGKIWQSDLSKLDGADDVKVFERLCRRLKSLVDAGKVRKIGRGQDARYRLKG